jgi:hypothetical protein
MKRVSLKKKLEHIDECVASDPFAIYRMQSQLRGRFGLSEDEANDVIFEWKRGKGGIVLEMLETLKAVRTYLEVRGIRTRGTVGRTIILPQIDAAIQKASRQIRGQ